jgi:beta-1,4-mannooligosaccharide/beta-1,4-mannosyl-N-acetylglucosamine phosphorylase
MVDKKQQTVAGELRNIPWEDRPAGNNEILWRSQRNPIIPRNLIACANSIFNSAVVPFEGSFAGVFRCDNRVREMRLHAGFSDNGFDWRLDEQPIKFESDNPEIGKFEYGYDPRVVEIDGRYYVTWCNGYHGPTIGLAYTHDFRNFRQTENLFLPYNRNGVLFPRKVRGKYAILSRPSYSESPDLSHWGCHRHVMSPAGGWQSTKIGAGPVPIETTEGWLLIYHGVLTSCSGFVYHAGAALLDLDEPWKVRGRTAAYILSPQQLYECVGDVPNVVFPCAVLCDGRTGRMAIYYGCADTVTGLAFAYVDELLEFIKNNSLPA